MCPACGCPRFRLAVPETQIRAEIRWRSEFVRIRMGRRAGRAELKDLTEFMHGFPAPLLACEGCGLLRRGERSVRKAGHYEEDPNDLDLMSQLFPRYVEAFRRKAMFREWLPPRADVVEVGSHLGAFLQTAGEWNWNPVGLDIGRDTSEFIRRRGHAVQRAVLEDARVRERSQDAVFLWNLFEQLPDPESTLRAARGLLKRHGLVVIRVPSGAYYRRRDVPFLVRAYNNLLGFPYLHGYTREALDLLLARAGMERLVEVKSALLTMPFPDLPDRIGREQREAQPPGPWMELIYRDAAAR